MNTVHSSPVFSFDSLLSPCVCRAQEEHRRCTTEAKLRSKATSFPLNFLPSRKKRR